MPTFRPALPLALAYALSSALMSPIAVAAADASALPKGVTAGPCVEGLCEYTLGNGLRVLLLPDVGTTKVTVNIVYNVGSANENYGETGMAHLLEHLLFKGTPRHGDIPGEMKKRGIEKNATTWLDRTHYYGMFPANDATLDWVLDLEADRMVHSFIAKKELDSEMTVVRNEMESRENSPVGITLERVRSAAYLWHNYGNSTIGARSDIEHVPIERLQRFYRTWYRPDNATLIVAGRIDPTTTLAKIQRTFGPLKRPADPLPASYTVEPTQDGEREVAVRRVGDLRVVVAAYHSVGATHPDNAALSVLLDILGDTPSGRLHKALVEPKLAATTAAFGDALRDGGLMMVVAITPKDSDIAKAENELLLQTETIAGRAITDEEVNDAKRRIANGYEDALNQSESLATQITDAVATGDWRLFFLRRDRIAAVTTADVNRVAQTYFKASNRTTGRFIPTDAPDRVDIPASPAAADAMTGYVAKAAANTGEAFDASAANIDARSDTFTIGNTLKVLLLPKDTRGDTVLFNATFRFGNVDALRRVSPMASTFAGNLLMTGSTTMTREQIAKRFETLRTSAGIGGAAQLATINLNSHRDTLADALSLAADVLRHPQFPASEFEQARLQWITGLEASRKEPGTVAGMAMSRDFNPWPADHPFAFRSLEQTLADLRALKLEDVAAFHRDFYGTLEGEITVIGDFDADALKAQLQALFSDWRSPSPYASVPATHHPVSATRMRADTPDKANAVFMARLNLPLNQEDPDYPALVIASRIFGGDPLKARLADRLRQKEGLSYSVSSNLGFSTRKGDDAGNLSIQAIAAPENIARVEAGAREELARWVEQGVTATELRDSVNALRVEREQWRGDDARLSGTLGNNLHLGRTMAWWADADRKLQALTVDEVNAALRKHIRPDTLSVYAAGDFAKAAAKE